MTSGEKLVAIVVTPGTVYRTDQGGEILCPPFLTKPARLRSIYREVITLKRSSHLNILELIRIMVDGESYATAVPYQEF